MTSLKVSLILLCYRQEHFIKDAVNSALAQTGNPIEIIISDDASPDGTWEIIKSIATKYSGPHEVKLNRNIENMGLIAHFNQILSQTTGEIITYMAGDDISAPNRVQLSVECLASNPEATFVESTSSTIGKGYSPANKKTDGLSGKPCSFSLSDYVSGEAPNLSSATRTFRKQPLMLFPPLDTRLSSEDSPNALRLLLQGSGLQINHSLLYKRVHENNITGAAGLMKINFDQITEQYSADIRYACERGIISKARAKQLQKCTHQMIEARKLRRIVDLRHPGLLELIHLILPSQYLSLKAKIYAIRRFFLSPSLKGK